MKLLSYILWILGGFLGISLIIYIASVFIIINIYRKYEKEI